MQQVRCKIGVIAIAITGLLSACEEKASVGTVLHEDGSVDRTIQLTTTDNTRPVANFFGLKADQGWEVTVDTLTAQTDDTQQAKRGDAVTVDSLTDTSHDSPQAKQTTRYQVTFRRHFQDVDQLNQLQPQGDTVLLINAKLERKFRWFYTYWTYTDIYHGPEYLRRSPVEDFFTPEDFAFIDRMPARDKPVSKADSLYLEMLEDKFSAHYLLDLLEDSYMKILHTAFASDPATKAYVDSLPAKRAKVKAMLKSEGMNEHSIDSLGIPVTTEARALFKKLYAAEERKLTTCLFIDITPIRHALTMPGQLVSTNADSVSGNQMFWSPLPIKFILKDQHMYGETRQLNLWAVIVTIALVVLTVVQFFRRR